ncbi:MAG TPA: BrnT family toxin [Thermoanaerobaculia bacterium]|nr:BrnT family toxin [Thermoanaerobaculia bacterium]
MLFEWDPEKDRRNRAKHGISFAEAASVFGDPLAETSDDPDHSVEELRFVTVGKSSRGRLLLVAHCDRADRIRLISARETTRRERQDHED